jgi:hypothetical protein
MSDLANRCERIIVRYSKSTSETRTRDTRNDRNVNTTAIASTGSETSRAAFALLVLLELTTNQIDCARSKTAALRLCEVSLELVGSSTVFGD